MHIKDVEKIVVKVTFYNLLDCGCDLSVSVKGGHFITYTFCFSRVHAY